MYAEGFPEMGAEEDIWAYEGRGKRGVETAILQGALCSLVLTRYHSGDEVKKKVIGGAYSTYRGNEKCLQGLVGRSEGKRPLVKPRIR
jgi:hypothetical protein